MRHQSLPCQASRAVVTGYWVKSDLSGSLGGMNPRGVHDGINDKDDQGEASHESWIHRVG